MKNAIHRLFKQENGEVMLEASIVLVMVMLLLIALLSISFFFYQQAMMTTIASEVATDIAKNYKYSDVEMGSDEITLSNYSDVQMYRMSFGRKRTERAQVARAEAYVAQRINLTSLGLNSGEPTVECKISHSGIGRAYVTVTITQKADFFMSGILEMLGIYDGDSFSASASAECMDLLSYTAMINFADYLGSEMAPLNAFGDAYESVKDFIEVLTD